MKGVLFILLFVPLVALGYDLSLSDGTVLKEIKLIEKSDMGIKVLHTTGIAFVDYAQIPAPDLYTWGFDEEKYKAAKAATSRAATVDHSRPVALDQPRYRPTRHYHSSSTATEATRVPSRASVSSTASGIRSQCSASTKKGYRCSRMAQAGSSTCYQH